MKLLLQCWVFFKDNWFKIILLLLLAYAIFVNRIDIDVWHHAEAKGGLDFGFSR